MCSLGASHRKLIPFPFKIGDQVRSRPGYPTFKAAVSDVLSAFSVKLSDHSIVGVEMLELIAVVPACPLPLAAKSA